MGQPTKMESKRQDATARSPHTEGACGHPTPAMATLRPPGRSAHWFVHMHCGLGRVKSPQNFLELSVWSPAQHRHAGSTVDGWMSGLTR